MIRDIGGTGTGNGPFIVLHDGFVQQGIPVSRGGWMGFLPGSDRVSLDSHPYLCFGPPNNDGLAFQATKVSLSSNSYWMSADEVWDSHARSGRHSSTRRRRSLDSRWEENGLSPVSPVPLSPSSRILTRVGSQRLWEVDQQRRRRIEVRRDVLRTWQHAGSRVRFRR